MNSWLTDFLFLDLRQKRFTVSTASQTLLSRRMRTREGENIFLAQADFSRKTVERSEEPIQFTLGGKKISIELCRLLVREPLYLVDQFVCLHQHNLSASSPGSKAEKRSRSSEIKENCSPNTQP